MRTYWRACFATSGSKPGDLVGQCVERSASLVVAALAIVRAGAGYVAIDPMYPAERVQWMLDDSGATAVVSDVGTAARLGGYGGRPALVVASGGELSDESDRDGDEALLRTTAADRPRLRGVHVWIDRAAPKGCWSSTPAWPTWSSGIERRSRCMPTTAAPRSPAQDSTRRSGRSGRACRVGASIHVVPEDSAD